MDHEKIPVLRPCVYHDADSKPLMMKVKLCPDRTLIPCIMTRIFHLSYCGESGDRIHHNRAVRNI